MGGQSYWLYYQGWWVVSAAANVHLEVSEAGALDVTETGAEAQGKEAEAEEWAEEADMAQVRAEMEPETDTDIDP